MQIKNFENSEELFIYAANDFLQKAKEAIAQKSYFDVALSGGSTAIFFFKQLAKEKIEQSVLDNTRFFFSDERALPLTNEKSNAYNALQILIPAGFKREQFFPMFNEQIGVKKSAKDYEMLIKRLLTKKTAAAVPTFDLLYLGIGNDGHTASLFPQSDLVSLESNDLVQAFKDENIEFERITFCPKLILNAQKIVFLVTGKEKKEIINKVLYHDYDPQKLPSQLIVKHAKNAFLFIAS